MSSDFVFRLQGEIEATVLLLMGDLTISGLDKACASLGRALQGRQVSEISLAGLRRADSGAIALLVDFFAQARAAHKPAPRIRDLPTHLKELVELYHLQHVFSLV